MARSKEYQSLLNSKKWRELRAWKLSVNPLCERCQEEGYVTMAVDVHHKRPVESAKTKEEMRRLAFSMSNLQSLCVPCHIKVHQEMKAHTKEAVRANKQRDLQRWADSHPAPGAKTDESEP